MTHALLKGGLMRAFIAIVCVVRLGSAVVPFNEPFQIVRPTADHKSMAIVRDGLEKLQEHDTSISLLSVVGPYHSGKSFLLNSLLGAMKAFMVGKQTSPETMGIWLCRSSQKAEDGSEIWLMDSEGFFGPGIDEGYDAKVFTVASLLGSHLVYNTVKIIDQQAVNLLEILMTQAQLFGARSSVRATGPVPPEFLQIESFPPLTWVVEDFVQELPAVFKQEGPIGYLTTYLQSSSGTQGLSGSLSARGNETRDTIITKTFRDVKVAHLFLPATSKEQLQDLSRLEWSELTEEYRSEVSTLHGHLAKSIKARKLDGKPATGPALAQALHFVIQALQQGMFHELPSLWTSWTSQVAEMSLGDADEWFSSLLQDVDRGEDPIPLAVFNGHVEKARERATGFYRNLIRDFNVRPQMGELRQRMDRHFDRKQATYHERTRRWVLELIAHAKDVFAKYLSQFMLPMDPASLEKQAKTYSEVLARNLTSQVEKFSKAGLKVTLGPAAYMPTFVQAPATQLANDFRAQLSVRSSENDREVERIFKVASAAADEAVEGELSQNVEQLLGQARVVQITKTAELGCWRAFEDRLGAYPWAANIARYQSAKAEVQKSAYEARVTRFTAANEKRLSAHMNTGLQSALGAFKEKGYRISMPASEADVANQHAQLAAATQEHLADYAKALTDTKAFKEANQKLADKMAEGKQELQAKNVELWKIYSDGATRCAAAANNERASGGMFSLFNNVPWWHRSISRKNLNECFAKDSFAYKMSAELQAQVFEVWYTKDMAQAGARVSNRFTILWIAALAGLASVWWYLDGSRRWYMWRYGQYPMQGGFYQPRTMPQGMWQGSGGYGLRQDACYGTQQSLYGQQVMPSQQYAPSMTQRRGFFGA